MTHGDYQKLATTNEERSKNRKEVDACDIPEPEETSHESKRTLKNMDEKEEQDGDRSVTSSETDVPLTLPQWYVSDRKLRCIIIDGVHRGGARASR